MKKVYQRIIDPKKGDCFKCCIASLLELDYDEVPNFVEQEDWFGAAIDFCKEHGYDFAYREYFNPNLNYLEDPTHGCFKPWNLDGTYHLDKLGREEGIDGLFLAGVYSPKYTNAGEHPMSLARPSQRKIGSASRKSISSPSITEAIRRANAFRSRNLRGR